MKIGDSVKILIGDWKDEIGIVRGIHEEYPIPISVEFSDGDWNNYTREQVEAQYR